MKSEKVQLKALTSLRFFAAFMILILHSGELFGLHWITKNFALSHGVSFFFVLSGFILTYNYAGDSRNSNWPTYFLHRFARLWPLHVAALILWFAMFAHPLDGVMSAPFASESLIANLLMVHSWMPIRQFFFSFNTVSWSIATEAMFYILFPLLFARKNVLPWTGMVFSISALLLLGLTGDFLKAPTDSQAPVVSLVGLLYVNPLARLFEFAVGCFACQIFRARREGQGSSDLAVEVASIGLFVLSCWLWKDARLAKFIMAIFGPAGAIYLHNAGSAIPAALLIYTFAKAAGPIGGLLSAPSLLFLGEISYALYLVHLTIFRWFEQRAAYFADRLDMMLVYVLISLIAAIAMHLWIEVPVRRAIVNFRMPRLPENGFRRAVAMLCACLVAVAGLQVWSPAIALSIADNELRRFTESDNKIEVNGRFLEFAELVSVRVPSKADGKLEMLWKSTDMIPADLLVGIQLYDAEGKQIANHTVSQRSAAGSAEGKLWISKIDMGLPSDHKMPTKIAVLLFQDWRKPFSVTAQLTDWDNHRVIIPVTR